MISAWPGSLLSLWDIKGNTVTWWHGVLSCLYVYDSLLDWSFALFIKQDFFPGPPVLDAVVVCHSFQGPYKEATRPIGLRIWSCPAVQFPAKAARTGDVFCPRRRPQQQIFCTSLWLFEENIWNIFEVLMLHSDLTVMHVMGDGQLWLPKTEIHVKPFQAAGPCGSQGLCSPSLPC